MLPDELRLRKNHEFRRAYSRGRAHVHELVVLHALKRRDDPKDNMRLGFVVTKKQGNAVARNRIRRRLREAVRARLDEFSASRTDLVFVGRSKARMASWHEVQAAVDQVLTRAGTLHLAASVEPT